MSRIDPIRRAALLRRAVRPETDDVDEAPKAYSANLPVPVDAPRTVPPRNSGPQGEAAFAAQLMGQDGQKRGLRAGAELIDHAKTSYVRTEWSGSYDRRARKGRLTNTDI
ncbi:hypothetical protein [Phenylobacterium sp. J367]|uniref:hypothetical protein n=1 Tax=Phenylobacterium sp. J367 TaxID=2898435 RepID=UPI0021513C39|nr:hypothetical protein [Phenylobacterium sp. J367]MCR5877656.1 hypothetical protein [Phenylobacterium sp. J367]